MAVLCKMEFVQKWIDWIWACILTSFSFFVNGLPSCIFQSMRSLRQRDPYPLICFVLVMETLSFLLRELREGGFISGFQIGGEEREVSHLLFDDLTLLFCQPYLD